MERKMTEKQLAQKIGVTPAGLKFLASLVATGKASQRGSECQPLFDAGLIVPNREVPEGPGRSNTYWSRNWWTITDQGKQVVQQARQLGW